jgi:UDP:flavonoid glycosyltransferase YjiC (YdhE family)
MANRVVRQGSARLIRPLTADALVAAVNEVLSSPGYRKAAQNAAAGAAGVADPVRVCHEALALTG